MQDAIEKLLDEITKLESKLFRVGNMDPIDEEERFEKIFLFGIGEVGNRVVKELEIERLNKLFYKSKIKLVNLTLRENRDGDLGIDILLFVTTPSLKNFSEIISYIKNEDMIECCRCFVILITPLDIKSIIKSVNKNLLKEILKFTNMVIFNINVNEKGIENINHFTQLRRYLINFISTFSNELLSLDTYRYPKNGRIGEFKMLTVKEPIIEWDPDKFLSGIDVDYPGYICDIFLSFLANDKAFDTVTVNEVCKIIDAIAEKFKCENLTWLFAPQIVKGEYLDIGLTVLMKLENIP